MRPAFFALLFGTAIAMGCDDDDAKTNVPSGPSSGSTVAPPPPVTPTTQPSTAPAASSSPDLIDQHRREHKLPAPPAQRQPR